MVPADELDAEYVQVVVELLEALGAGCRGQTGLDVDVAQAADLELIPAHDAISDERLVSLRLVEAPDQLPHLRSMASAFFQLGGAILPRATRAHGLGKKHPTGQARGIGRGAPDPREIAAREGEATRSKYQ